jgi:hypothetical protein
MADETITLTLDGDSLAALRSLVGDGGLPAAVDAAIAAHVTHLEQLNEAQEWIDELKAYDAVRSQSS